MSSPKAVLRQTEPEEQVCMKVPSDQNTLNNLSDAFDTLSVAEKSRPKPAERSVLMGKERKLSTKQLPEKPEYENTGVPRHPVGGVPTGQQSSPVRIDNYPSSVPGQKRQQQMGYFNNNCHSDVYLLNDNKVKKPMPFDIDRDQRLEMAQRNNFAKFPFQPGNRRPVESIDPSVAYQNGSMIGQNQLNPSNYLNISSLPTSVKGVAGKSPRVAPRADQEFAPLPEMSGKDVNAVLNCPVPDPEYVNLAYQQYRQNVNLPNYQHTGQSEFAGRTEQMGCQTFSGQSVRAHRHSESQNSSASRSSFSLTNSPNSQHHYPINFSPPSMPNYTRLQLDHSPNHVPYSPVPYSPVQGSHSPYQPSPSPETFPYMNSPTGSHSLSSPYSSAASGNSPEDQTLYPSDSSYKEFEQNCFSQKLNSLTDDLTDLADHTNIGLDKFQLLTPSTSSAQTQLQPTSSVNYTANYAPATTSYPTMHSSNLQHPERFVNHGAPALPCGQVSEALYYHQQYPPTVYAPPAMHGAPVTCNVTSTSNLIPQSLQSYSAPTNPAAVTATANMPPPGKMAIPPLKQPQTTPTAPTAVLVCVIPQQPQKRVLPNLAPKPPTESDANKTKKTVTTASKSKGKGNGGSSKKPSILGLEKSKEMIAAKSDEQLLNKTTDGSSCLHQAIMSKEQAMILAMLGAIKSRPALKPLIEMANAKQQTPLFLAVTAGQTWLTKMLVQQMGADCNAHSLLEVCQGQFESRTPLHYASSRGEKCLEELKIMLASPNTNVNHVDVSGATALHLAVWYDGRVDTKTKKAIDSTPVVRTLLEAGAQAHIKHNKCGKTALHYAVDKCSLQLTRLILESENQLTTLINETTYESKTALHLAVSLLTISEENQIDLVKYLIAKGANKNAKDNDRKTPRDLIGITHCNMLKLFDDSLTTPIYYSTPDDSYLYDP